ncbi:histone-lysine N-methyltransferase, H3 lysine-9 specific SUVH4 [Dorcoceras hygrometricum]|uniref:Histone-lysine N-methyltransferase, H3 lysine-9 specific SUVH4 n=1 Tax=Dorcoceras hygrometricum TaxID=472368 RepID=A0A2Z7A4R3_9LAMI|nr:histone-lysine N-methyltransferase, H3 lysine-9 specific SUVH4 [Dorcoceras hygrometricum]
MVLLCSDELSDAASARSSRYPLRKTIARVVEKVEPQLNKVSKIPKKRKLEMQPLSADDVVHNVVADSTKSAYALVTETLRNFNKLYLQCIQEEEKRCARQEADEKGSAKRVSQPKVYI